jgi:3-oxoacyl-[acyl-carrier protein] reductase
MKDLKGKTVVVTGGATGIGGAATRAFAEAGSKVLAQYLGGKAEAEALASQGVHTVQLDLTADGGPRKLINEAIARLGHVDVLVNNAGSLVARTLIESVDDKLIDAVFDLNCRQLIHCCRLGAEHMKGRGRGNIINVSSIAASVGGSPGASIYAGAKGFVSSFSKSLAKELVGHGIRVNCVSPGTIHTSFHDRFSTAEKREAARQTIPMQRLGLAEDCAGTFLYLASDAASAYVTGQVIEVNGGQLMA